ADYRTSYVQSWHLTVQREIKKDLVVDVAYVGNRSNGLMTLGDYNQSRPNAIGENLTILQRRPIQNFDYIQISWGGGFATYHALQTKIEKRYAAGVYLLNSFTWSKAIDNASGHLEAANGDNSRLNFRNTGSEKGLGAYNQPLNNTTTLVWELPYGKGRRWGANIHPVVDGIVGGWRLTGINTMTSGQPINITYGPAAAGQVSGAPSYRPNYVGGDIYSAERSPTNYFNRAAFAVPPINQPFGTLGRNIAQTEGIFNFDLGLHKEFPLWSESSRLQFRSEFFNLFNTTNLGAPGQTITNANFGQITSLSSPARQIQFALKLVF
ncbi:MAG: TonB-dependent receptor, partial [Bryobacterales bacterium]|nr:TonB-dependent receptor [Bryobacterales bacterium]